MTTYSSQNLNMYVNIDEEFDFLVKHGQLLRLDQVLSGKPHLIENSMF